MVLKYCICFSRIHRGETKTAAKIDADIPPYETIVNNFYCKQRLKILISLDADHYRFYDFQICVCFT